MLEDLTMLATQPVDEAAVKKAEGDDELQHEIDKAAGGQTMPPPKDKDEDPAHDSRRERIARRGQDPQAHEDCD